jgi:hypothetical protein
LIAVRADAEITAYHVLKADKDFEFFHTLLCIEIHVVVGSDSSDRKVKPVASNVLADRGYLEAEHHALVVDCLVLIQQLPYILVDSLGSSALDDMADPNGWFFDVLSGEYLAGGIPYGLNEAAMRDGDFIVFREDRHYTLLF